MSFGMVAGAVIGVAGSAIISRQSNKSADRRAAAALGPQQLLAEISAEEWDLYQREAVPMLRELVGMRTPRSVEEEQALAAGEVKGAFGQARQQLERAVGRTRNPGDPGYAAILAPTYMDEAGAVSKAVTDARSRVDDRTWSRTLQAIQGYQRLPQDASSAAAASGSLANTSARTALLGRQQSSNEAAQAAYGITSIANAARRWMGQPSGSAAAQPTSFAGGGFDDYGNFAGPGYGGDVYNEYTGYDYAHGGRVRGPGTGRSDSVPAIVDGRERVQLSNGEYVIPADVVRKKGQEFFDKMLQKYHRPAPERDRGMADGGAIKRRGLPADVEDAIFVSLPREALSLRRGR